MDNDDLRIRNEQLEQEVSSGIFETFKINKVKFMSESSGMIFFEDQKGRKFQGIFIDSEKEVEIDG